MSDTDDSVATVTSVSVPAAVAPSSAPIALGDTVIFHEYADLDCDSLIDRAALVVAVWSPSCVNLLVFDQKGESRLVMSAIAGEKHREWTAKAVA